jgi:hypothetical protein
VYRLRAVEQVFESCAAESHYGFQYNLTGEVVNGLEPDKKIADSWLFSEKHFMWHDSIIH